MPCLTLIVFSHNSNQAKTTLTTNSAWSMNRANLSRNYFSVFGMLKANE